MFLNRKVLLPLTYWYDFDFTKIQEAEASDLIYISKNDYAKIASKDSSLIFKIFAHNHISKSTKNAVVRIGGYHNDQSNIVYAPNWVIEQIEKGNNSSILENKSILPSEPIIEEEEIEIKNPTVEFGKRIKLLQIYQAPIATQIKILIQNIEDVKRMEELAEKYSHLSVREIYEMSLHSYGGVEFNRSIPLLLKFQSPEENQIETLTIKVFITFVEPLNLHGYVRFDGDVVFDIETPEVIPPEPKTEIKDLSQELSQSLTREELRAARLRFFDNK